LGVFSTALFVQFVRYLPGFSSSIQRSFWVRHFLYALIPYFCQPKFYRLCFWAGD
jgi:hypothetical protein